ncbi:Tkl protein kinase, partial [Globisporangium splendens]
MAKDDAVRALDGAPLSAPAALGAAAAAPENPLMAAVGNVLVRTSSARDFAFGGATIEAAFLPEDTSSERGSLARDRRFSETSVTGASELHDAVQRGDLAQIEELIKSGDVDVETRDDQKGATALLLAAGKGKHQVVDLLLTLGADVNAQGGKNGMTPLHGAAKNGHFAVVERLILAGGATIQVNLLDRSGCTALYWAVRKGYLEIVAFLLDHGADPEATEADWRPLHTACAKDNLEMVQLLLSKGADVNATMESGVTPLDFTAAQGSIETAQMLLDGGADINTHDEKTATTPLHRAAIRGDLQMVTLLVSRGADVGSETIDGATPLCAAAEFGHAEVLKYLLAVDPNWREHRSSPIHTAAVNGHLEILDYLVSEEGLEVDVTNEFGVTPLCAAVLKGNLSIMEYLISNGADVNFKMAEDRDFTYLHFAAENGDEEATRMLIENNADIDAQDSFGYTPLHIAAVHGAVPVIDALMENGVDLYAEGHDGLTATYVAAASGQLRVLHYLQENGFIHDFDRQLPSDPKITPLSLAAAAGHLNVVKYLVDSQNRRWSTLNDVTSNDQTRQDQERETNDEVDADGLEYQRICRFDALISAVESDRLDVVGYFCEIGANHGMLQARDTTVLHTAAGLGRTLIADYLLQERHADLHERTSAGLTALHVAATTGQTEIIELLLAYGASVNERVETLATDDGDMAGMTPLHFAALFGHLDVLRILIRHGANIDAQSEQGAGVLECAREGANADLIPGIVDFLLAHGAIEQDASAAVGIRSCCFGGLFC